MSNTAPAAAPDAAIFDRGVYVIPLGYIQVVDAAPVVTLDDRPGGNMHGLRLDEATAEFLISIDPEETNRSYSQAERRALLQMANDGVVALFPATAPVGSLPIIPVLRTDIEIVDQLEDGYRVRADDSEFALSEIGARCIPQMDGRRTMGEIVAELGRSMIQDPATAAQLRQAIAADASFDFDAEMRLTAMNTVAILQDAEVATFELQGSGRR